MRFPLCSFHCSYRNHLFETHVHSTPLLTHLRVCFFSLSTHIQFIIDLISCLLKSWYFNFIFMLKNIRVFTVARRNILNFVNYHFAIHTHINWMLRQFTRNFRVIKSKHILGTSVTIYQSSIALYTISSWMNSVGQQISGNQIVNFDKKNRR